MEGCGCGFSNLFSTPFFSFFIATYGAILVPLTASCHPRYSRAGSIKRRGDSSADEGHSNSLWAAVRLALAGGNANQMRKIKLLKFPTQVLTYYGIILHPTWTSCAAFRPSWFGPSCPCLPPPFVSLSLSRDLVSFFGTPFCWCWKSDQLTLFFAPPSKGRSCSRCCCSAWLSSFSVKRTPPKCLSEEF